MTNKYLNLVNGKIYEIISENDEGVTFMLAHGGKPAFLGRSEFDKRFHLSPECTARAAMDKAFGIGVREAHRLLSENAGAKRIYDCALVALSDVLSSEVVLDQAKREAKLLGASYVRIDADGGADLLDPAMITFSSATVQGR